MRGIKFALRSFVYSNIFLAFCVAAYTAKTSLIVEGNNGSLRIAGIAFFITLFFYCFHRINKKKFLTPDENLEERNSWMNAHKNIYYILITLSIVILSILLFYMPLRAWLVFIPVALLGLGYTFPIIPANKGWKRLRDIYWLKTFWIAFAFAWLTTFLPVVYTEPSSCLITPEVLFVFIRSLLFLFAICIPFDIRDMPFDKAKGVTTLPVSLGGKISIYIAISLLLIFIALVSVDLLYFNLNPRVASALLLSALVTIILLPLAKTKRPALFFPLLYDGALLTQWIFLFLFLHS